MWNMSFHLHLPSSLFYNYKSYHDVCYVIEPLCNVYNTIGWTALASFVDGWTHHQKFLHTVVERHRGNPHLGSLMPDLWLLLIVRLSISQGTGFSHQWLNVRHHMLGDSTPACSHGTKLCLWRILLWGLVSHPCCCTPRISHGRSSSEWSSHREVLQKVFLERAVSTFAYRRVCVICSPMCWKPVEGEKSRPHGQSQRWSHHGNCYLLDMPRCHQTSKQWGYKSNQSDHYYEKSDP